MGPGGAGGLVRAVQVHRVDDVPVGVFHVAESNVPQDAGVVDEHVDAAKGADGGLDDALAVFDRVVVGDCCVAGFLEFFDYEVGYL
jgi:hypothetical protein